MEVVPRKAYDIYRGSEIIEFLFEIFCNAENFINPLQKLWIFLLWIMSKLKTMNSWKVEGWKFISEIWSFFLSILKNQNERVGRCMLSLFAFVVYRGEDLPPIFDGGGHPPNFPRGWTLPPHKPPRDGPWAIFNQSLPIAHFRRTADSSFNFMEFNF